MQEFMGESMLVVFAALGTALLLVVDCYQSSAWLPASKV
jgi:hypothetical protein